MFLLLQTNMYTRVYTKYLQLGHYRPLTDTTTGNKQGKIKTHNRLIRYLDRFWLSTMFASSLTVKALIVEMHIWCIAIGTVNFIKSILYYNSRNIAIHEDSWRLFGYHQFCEILPINKIIIRNMTSYVSYEIIIGGNYFCNSG